LVGLYNIIVDNNTSVLLTMQLTYCVRSCHRRIIAKNGKPKVHAQTLYDTIIINISVQVKQP